jgi:hypothetical protein
MICPRLKHLDSFFYPIRHGSLLQSLQFVSVSSSTYIVHALECVEIYYIGCCAGRCIQSRGSIILSWQHKPLGRWSLSIDALRRPRRTWRGTQIILDWKFKSVIDGTVVRLSHWLSRFALPGPVQEVFGLTTPRKISWVCVSTLPNRVLWVIFFYQETGEPIKEPNMGGLWSDWH